MAIKPACKELKYRVKGLEKEIIILKVNRGIIVKNESLSGFS